MCFKILCLNLYLCEDKRHTWSRMTAWEWVTNEPLITHAYCEVVVYMTDSIDAACSRTWIGTLLVDASLVWGAFTVKNTFRPASYKWISLKSRLATANCSVAICLADSIASTGGWLARIDGVLGYNRLDDLRPLVTLTVRVSIVILRARTPRCMIYYSTVSIESTDVSTRVGTFFPDTSQIGCTVSVLGTFWPAEWWLAKVTRSTSALSWTCDISTVWVRSTRCWITCILWRLSCGKG